MTIIDSDNEWSERIVIKKNQFSSAIVICLKLVFIEMLDKLITYIHTYIHKFLNLFLPPLPLLLWVNTYR
jgi:hypothetical protein